MCIQNFNVVLDNFFLILYLIAIGFCKLKGSSPKPKGKGGDPFYVNLDNIRFLSRRIDVQLMFGYYRYVEGLPMNFFETRKVGEIISCFMDAGKIRDALFIMPF